jgi:hypothetical protein
MLMEDCIVFLNNGIDMPKNFLDVINNFNDYIKVLVIEKNDLNDDYSHIFDKIIIVKSMNNYEVVSKDLEDIKKYYNIMNVVAAVETCVELGGFLRSFWGLYGLQFNQALSVRDKWMMYVVAHSNNIPCADAAVACNPIDYYNFVNSVGYPIVAKPFNMYSAIGVTKIDNINVLNDLVSGHVDCRCLLESYVDVKNEYHVDSIVSNGKIVFTSISKYLSPMLNVKTDSKSDGGIIIPSKFYNKSQLFTNILNMNNKIVDVFNLMDCTTHTEFMVTKDNKVIFGEIGVRLGGFQYLPAVINHHFNVDLYKAIIDVNLPDYNVNINERDGFTGYVLVTNDNGSVNDFMSIDGVVDLIPISHPNGFCLIAESDSLVNLEDILNSIHNKFPGRTIIN